MFSDGVRSASGRKLPTRSEALVFSAKAWGLRAGRWTQDLGGNVRLWPRDLTNSIKWFPLHESRSKLWVESSPAERELERGKVENLRLACARMEGAVIEADGLFSFWRQLGRAGKRQGFLPGRMLQQGCLIPSVGGGLCQLSNSLYELALLSGCEIVERHAHSARLAHMPLHDATVAWNYIDLRFRAKERMRVRAVVNEHELVIGFEGAQPAALRQLTTKPFATGEDARPSNIQSCASCGETACFRHREHAG